MFSTTCGPPSGAVDGVKIVPSNISELLTPRALAYWIMDDGGKGSYGETILHTRSFTLLPLLFFPGKKSEGRKYSYFNLP